MVVVVFAVDVCDLCESCCAKLLMLCAQGLGAASEALNPSMPQHVDAGWGC